MTSVTRGDSKLPPRLRTLTARWPWLGQLCFDIAFVLSMIGAHADVVDAETLFHVAFAVLAANAFFFGLASTAPRIAVAAVALVGIGVRTSVDPTAPKFALGEWPLMLTIAVLVAWLADRSAAAARHYAALYRSTALALAHAQESERKTLAREIHDGLGQSFTAFVLTLDAAESALGLGRNAEALARLQEARGLGTEALATARQVANDLRPARLEHAGLVPAIERHARRLLPHASITIDASGYESGALPPDVESELFRCVQEAVLNISRHASASTVHFELAGGPDRVAVTVCDDGIGFEQRDAGLGILGMRERAALLGGSVEIRSRLGEGTTVAVRVPRAAPSLDARAAL